LLSLAKNEKELDGLRRSRKFAEANRAACLSREACVSPTYKKKEIGESPAGSLKTIAS
jgi:hypothetical protein